MTQTRWMSLVESMANVVVGYVVAVIAQIVVFPLFGMHPTFAQNLWIGLYPNDTISILLSQPDVKFQPGQKFELWVMMETGIPAIGNGEAWDADYGGITYDGIVDTIDFLNSGRYLRMLGMGIDDGFDIDGIAPALVQAQDCLARQGGASGGKVLGAAPGGVKATPKVPDLSKPKTSGIGSGGGLGTRPGGALGTPAPKPQP